MQMKLNVRTCLFYEYKLGTTATEATKKIRTVFGNESLQVRVAQIWYGKFKDGHTNVQDDARSGRPSLIDDGLLRTAIEANPNLCCWELADQFSVCEETIRVHLQSLGK